MPAKKWWTSKKKTKKVVEEVKVEETPVEEEAKEVENAVETVIENEMVEEELPVWTVVQSEEEIFVKKQPKNVSGAVGDSVVVKPQGRIRFEAQVAPFPIFLLPPDIKRYLISHNLTTDVYKKDKEWLEKHNVDLEMVEKLKKFLTERL